MIMICGEAWGREEEEAGEPFVGASGKILNSMLAQIGINRRDCYITNVFNLRPKPTNDVKNLCGLKKDGIPGLPYLQKSKYVLAQYAPELERLRKEVESVKPNVIVAMGATPAWAFLQTSGIKKLRGAPVWSTTHNVKVLPTYHPAAVMRDWTLRPIVLADLDKAKREGEFSEIRRPKREIWVEPTREDLTLFHTYISASDYLSVDIETVGDMITCIGFAPTTDLSIVVPFFDPTKPGKNYWRTFEEELAAWQVVTYWLQLKKKYVFQNGMYDLHFLWRTMGITCPHATHDSMLLHHALQPEMPKGLDFLGTIYTDEAAWKLQRRTHTIKRED